MLPPTKRGGAFVKEPVTGRTEAPPNSYVDSSYLEPQNATILGKRVIRHN